MKRRQFLGTVVAAPAVTAAATAAAQEGPPVIDPVEKMTVPERPAIALNHLGFRPRVGSKVLVVRALASPTPREYHLRDVSERHFSFRRPLAEARSDGGSDVGPCLTRAEQWRVRELIWS